MNRPLVLLLVTGLAFGCNFPLGKLAVAAGVNPALTQSLLQHIKDLREQGMTVLFVEHDMDMVHDIGDWVIVMAMGQIIAEGPPGAVMKDQNVIDAYLGTHHDKELTESGKSLTVDSDPEGTNS